MFHQRFLIHAVAVLCCTGMSPAQEQSLKKRDVPKAVLAAFQQSYPRVTIKGYAKETDNGTVVYEVESVEGCIHRDVTYTADGSIVTTEESLAYTELPEPIRDAMTKEYPKAKISVCEKITKGLTTQFELIVQSGKRKNELVFNADGSLEKNEKK